MPRVVSRSLAFALAILIFTASSGRGIAQSTTTPPSPVTHTPSVITGTNPEPQDDIIEEILSFLFFA